ncbi:MAG: hypothetical protein AAFX99_11475 [Myxococcota bacterium]
MKIAIASEAEADFRVLCHLMDLVFMEQFEWFRDQIDGGTAPDDLRQWASVEGHPYLKTARAKSRFRELGLPLHTKRWGKDEGRIRGRALSARMAFLVLKRDAPDAEFYIFHNDTDGELNHIQEIHDARDGLSFHASCLVATPHPETEGWLLCGFQPKTPEEQRRHQDERRRLGFDPIVSSHELTARRQTDKRDAKRVLETLRPDTKDVVVLLGHDLAVLYARGAENRLADFIDEVRNRCCPQSQATENRPARDQSLKK